MLVARNNSSLTIRWSPSNNAVTYTVQLFFENMNNMITTRNVSVPTVTFTALSPSTSYILNIVTIGAAGNSLGSNFPIQTGTNNAQVVGKFFVLKL